MIASSASPSITREQGAAARRKGQRHAEQVIGWFEQGMVTLAYLDAYVDTARAEDVAESDRARAIEHGARATTVESYLDRRWTEGQ